jgi:hypothetical protein
MLLKGKDTGPCLYLVQAIAHPESEILRHPSILLYILSRGSSVRGVEVYEKCASGAQLRFTSQQVWESDGASAAGETRWLELRIYYARDPSKGFLLSREPIPSDESVSSSSARVGCSHERIDGLFFIQVYDQSGNRSNRVELDWGGAYS